MRILISSLLLALSSPTFAMQDAAPADPAAEDTVIVFGGPESLTIETAEAAHEFTIEIAETPDQLQRGMMWRESMDPDSGMLFVYDPVRPASMWMRNTLISLDILYVRENGEVAKIIAHAQPGSLRQLGSSFPVAAVLEIAGGRSVELGIRPGAILRHAMFDNLDVTSGAAETPAEDAESADEVESAEQ